MDSSQIITPSSSQIGEISCEVITITRAKLLTENDCLKSELKCINEHCDKLVLQNREQSMEITKLKDECEKRLRFVMQQEVAQQKQTDVMASLQEYLYVLVDKMNEYEERRATRDVHLESVLNDATQKAKTHKTEVNELLGKLKYLEDQFNCKCSENEEFERNNNYLHSKLEASNAELQTLLVQIEEQIDLKLKISSLSDEKEELIERITNLEAENVFFQEKNVALIENERIVEEKFQKHQAQWFQDSEELQRQIVELDKLNDQMNNMKLDMKSQMENLQLEFDGKLNALKEENVNLSTELKETVASNANYENAVKTELEDERQKVVRVQLHNDTLVNRNDELTKQKTNIETHMVTLREENVELKEKLKNFDDLKNFKRPAPKRTMFYDEDEIYFTGVGSQNSYSKKSKPSTERTSGGLRKARLISSDSDFSTYDDSSALATDAVTANRPKVADKKMNFFSQQVNRSKLINEAPAFSIDSSSSRNDSTE